MVLEKFLPRKPEKEVFSMRISTDMLEKIDAKAAAFALAHMGKTEE